MGMDIDQIDISTAYLNGDLDKSIYMRNPGVAERKLREIDKFGWQKKCYRQKSCENA